MNKYINKTNKQNKYLVLLLLSGYLVSLFDKNSIQVNVDCQPAFHLRHGNDRDSF